ncbi:MAG TPA: glycosyltransferase [Aggregatilineales bacterium]|nr:glycosyltransferase [Aggregatilineales bacterium]
MRVLLLTQVLPYPPDSGPKIKTYHVIKYLAQRHRVTLVAFVRDTDKPEYIAHLKTLCERVITVPIQRAASRDLVFLGKSLLSGQPWMMLRDERPEMRAALAELAATSQFDIVHADQLNMGQYALPFPSGRKVLDLHNALWVLYKRMSEAQAFTNPMKYLLMRDWPLLKRYEAEMCRRFDAVTAVSEEDKAALIEAGAPSAMTVIPIAVDLDSQPYIERQPKGPHIIHIGTMYWPANINAINWFLDAIYPLIKARLPEVRCTLIGARPPESIIERAKADPSLTVTGYVDDPLPYLQDASMMIVPLKAGGGMRVKILNALAQGIPMVTTTVGCEGIAVTPDKDILIADEPAAFAEASLRLLTDADLNQRISQNGRDMVMRRYDYREAVKPLDDVYAEIVAKPAKG